jgi:hypothetical protein
VPLLINAGYAVPCTFFADRPPGQLLAFFITDENCGPLVIPAQDD